MTRASSCPSSFALQSFALTDEDPEARVVEHLASCAACQAFVNEARASGQAYLKSAAALALRQQLGDLARPGPGLHRRISIHFWAWGGGLAAAAALLLVLASGFSPLAGDGAGNPATKDTLHPKGSAQLSLWVGDGVRADAPLGESRVLHPADRVQPVFAAPGKGFVVLLLTTPQGQVIQLHPTGGAHAVSVEGSAPAPLGPSFRLDEEVGHYHVTAFFAEQAFATAGLSDRVASAREKPFPGVVLVERFEVRRSW